MYSRQFVETLRKESDRACGVLGAALLDAMLEQFFRQIMIESAPDHLFEGTGPLATFSAKIDLAYNLGFISPEEHNEFTIVRRIRNDFAHAVDHELNFERPPVSNRAENLRFAELIADSPNSQLTEDEKRDVRGNPRRRFEVGVGTLAFFLDQRTKAAVHAQSPLGIVPKL